MAHTVAELKEREQRHITEAFGEGNFELIDEFVAADFIAHTPEGWDDIHGPEEYKEFYAEFHSAFPDLDVTVEDLFAEGNRVVSRPRISGTHTGNLRGLPPTGESIDVTTIDIKVYNDDGKAIEAWTQGDAVAMRKQLGLTFPAIIGKLPKLVWGKLRASL